MPNVISEDQIEQAAVKILTDELGYRHLNCFTADSEDLNDRSNRASKSDVLLLELLRRQTRLINPHIPSNAIDDAITQLTKKRTAMSPLAANKEISDLLRDGVPVEFDNEQGKPVQERVRLIDFNTPENNDFLAVTQLWIKGERIFRRPDIILYINGIPLVFIELKNSTIKLKQAYDKNLSDYKKDIPQLFLTNGFCVLSNAIETRIGSFTAGWEYFFRWLRAEDEKEKVNSKSVRKEGTSLQRLLYGLFPHARLLDYLENFILFHDAGVKIVAQNHQFLGVNKAVESLKEREAKQGRLGVFWHTQGSGKSFSMIFLARKVFRKFTGNFTFVIVTDREDLDGQIYRNFLNTGTVKEKEAAQPKNSRQMREFLSQNKRIVFTLIQKFRYDKGKDFPILLDPDDTSREVIVIVDEAHRTQYKSLAENMRQGLPGAHYFAFTGTPLLGKGRKTSKWFGDYVSEYNFSQAMDDESTVPLFYEKRVPEVLIQNEDLGDEFYEILEDENLDEKQQEKLEKEFSQELQVIKRDDRLDTIARDIVYHFTRRGYLGKGMVISVDKFTSVKMYNKVQDYWKLELKRLTGERSKADAAGKERLNRQLSYMRSVEMAVIISEDGKEEEKFKLQDLEIKSHRTKINAIDANGHDIEYRFKDPADPLQLVFVCAMWLTGFDAPTVSTLYMDKPMKDHTLMQTIARANRVSSYQIQGVRKTNGEVVDYYNVFRNMKKALAAYALGSDDEPPVREKKHLFKLLDDALKEGQAFCTKIGIEIAGVLDSDDTFKNIGAFQAFADIILGKDEWKQEFNIYENTISSIYEACKPEILSKQKRPLVFVFQYLRGVIDGFTGTDDVESARQRVNELLDQSVITSNEGEFWHEQEEGYFKSVIKKSKSWNLANVDFEKMREQFKNKKYKNIEITDLRSFIEKKLQQMLAQNSTRTNFAEKFQQIIDTYNSGGSSTDNFYEDLVKFTEDLKEEDERHIKEGLSEDELELYDILKKEKLTKEEEKKVKLAAKRLLKRLIEEQPKVLVQDWFKNSQTQAKVKKAVEDILDAQLPDSYDRAIFTNKCNDVYDLVYDYSEKGIKWAA
ncbi:type I restriction endonuclease subunit R [bacterium]|nr:type I restriction endonuclease subunit R [bacterium]